MDPTPPSIPPPIPSKPSLMSRYGCLIILAGVILLVVITLAGLYYTLFGTPTPFRMIADAIHKANPSVEITGVTGNLSSGVAVESITWGDHPKSRSEILDLRIKYNGGRDMSMKPRVVISDVGVRKAHIDLADFGPSSGTTTTSASAGTASNPQTSASANGGFPPGLSSFEIEHVDIEDVLITNRNTDFRLAIPKIEWTGFKATAAGVDPGVLTVDSDRLTIHTSAGRTLPLNGQDTTFQKMLTGTVLPLMHPALKQPVTFTADIAVSHGRLRPFHLLTAGDKVEAAVTDEGDTAVQVRGLDLPAFLDARKLFGEQAGDLPGDLKLNLAAGQGFGDGRGRVKVIGGNFRLGVSTFEIQPLEFAEAEQSGAILQAILKTDAGNIVWALPLANFGHEYHPHFISTGLSPEETLARVFAGKPYGELNADEKQAVDERRPIYFPPVEK